jgi:hypothetical protein
MDKDKHWVRAERQKKFSQTNGPPKQLRIAIFISDKIVFKQKLFKRDEEGCFIFFILIKVIIHQEKVTIINIHVPNIATPNFIKQTLLDLQTQTDCSTLIAEDFNILLSPTDKSSKHKINKEASELMNAIDQMDFIIRE